MMQLEFDPCDRPIAVLLTRDMDSKLRSIALAKQLPVSRVVRAILDEWLAFNFAELGVKQVEVEPRKRNRKVKKEGQP